MARRLHHLLRHYGPGLRGRGCRLGHRLHYQGAGRGTPRRLGDPGSSLDVELHRMFVVMHFRGDGTNSMFPRAPF